ncbi:hypothetical protein ACIB24_05450 [Spongisporangium articulatum]|uniref:Uncharacterized protein n=1 Tax=Spongisporangium articulatum TaxID=3362603 RepID=A0ABW8ALJ1_9ACTN
MLHTAGTPDADSVHGESPSAPLANPRRTRLGADGRPITGPVSTTD